MDPPELRGLVWQGQGDRLGIISQREREIGLPVPIRKVRAVQDVKQSPDVATDEKREVVTAMCERQAGPPGRS